MRKSKKVLFSVAAVALSAVVFTATALASVSKVSGYESLKRAGINMMQEDNYSMSGKFKISVDGGTPAEIGVTAKTQSSTNSTTTTTVGEGDKQVKLHTEFIDGEMRCIYELPDGSFLKQDIGFTHARYVSGFDDSEVNDKELRLAEVVLDILSGDVKNYFSTDGNRVSFSLQQNQVPELVQLLLTLMTEPGNKAEDDSENMKFTISDGHTIREFDEFAGILTGADAPPIVKQKLEIFEGSINILNNGPQGQFEELFDNLSEGLVMKNVHFESTLTDDNLIDDMKIGIDMSGKDKDGFEHTITVYIDLDMFDYGTTTVDALDLNGKEVYDLPMPGFDGRVFTIEQ